MLTSSNPNLNRSSTDSTHHNSNNNNLTNLNQSKSYRHSFWAGLGFKHRSNSKFKKNSSPTSPQQHTYNKSTPNASSRVIAMVGNLRTGIGRMILEELVSQKFIVVALIDKNDSSFSKSVQDLASSPSLFHAFVLESGLFEHQCDSSDHLDHSTSQSLQVDHQQSHNINNNNNNNNSSKRSSRSSVFRSLRLVNYNKSFPKSVPHFSSTTSTLADSNTELSSYSSLNSISLLQPRHNNTTLQRSPHQSQILELKNIFQAYRVDTVICSFEPQLLEPPTGIRAKARFEDEKQFGLTPTAERSRVERMERVVLEACLASGSVDRFAVTIHPTSLNPSVLSPKPTQSIRPHLRSALSDQFPIPHSSPPIHITEFRWGYLMNELAFDDSLADGATAENALGKWLCEPPKSRWIVDFAHRRALIPVRTSSPRESTKKGKQKHEPVCMTLAEDVARFVGLACKSKGHWQWKTGRIVGDCVTGGWEETIETIEKISRKNLNREFVCLNSSSNGYASDSGSSDSSLYQPKSSSNSDSLDPNPQTPSPRFSNQDYFKFEDELRSHLAKESQDASSVSMREFIRVWYTPLLQPPPIRIDGNRFRQKPSSRHPSIPAPRGSFKPQVGENGTLREPTLKANTLNDRSKTSDQFLPVPTSRLLSFPDTHNLIGQAISTDKPSSIPHQTDLYAHPQNDGSPIVSNEDSTQMRQEFNFVPKVIVPFNNKNQQHGDHSSNSVNMKDSKPQSESRPSSNVFSSNGLADLASVSKGMQQRKSFQNTSSYAGSKLEARSDPIYSQPPNIGNRFSRKLSLVANRDDNRILRRSPLATRVA